MGLKPVFFFILLLLVSDLSSAPGSSSTIGCCRDAIFGSGQTHNYTQGQPHQCKPLKSFSFGEWMNIPNIPLPFGLHKYLPSLWWVAPVSVNSAESRGVTLCRHFRDGHHFPNTHFNVYYLKKKYECPLLSNFLHFSSGRSGLHCPSTSGHLPLTPWWALVPLLHFQRTWLSLKEGKEYEKMKMSSPQDEEEEDNKDVEEEEEEDGDHLPAP